MMVSRHRPQTRTRGQYKTRIILENAARATDRSRLACASYMLPDNFENLAFTIMQLHRALQHLANTITAGPELTALSGYVAMTSVAVWVFVYSFVSMSLILFFVVSVFISFFFFFSFFVCFFCWFFVCLLFFFFFVFVLFFLFFVCFFFFLFLF